MILFQGSELSPREWPSRSETRLTSRRSRGTRSQPLPRAELVADYLNSISELSLFCYKDSYRLGTYFVNLFKIVCKVLRWLKKPHFYYNHYAMCED